MRLTPWIAAAAVTLGLGFAARTELTAGAASAATHPVTVDYARTADPMQRLDVWQAGPGPRPWVFTIHGGSWVYGDRHGREMDNARRLFLGLGYDVVNVDYRLLDPAAGITFPQQMSDVDTAFRYAVRHAARLGLDPTRVVLYGFSAGGHLAAELGLEGDGGTPVRGIVTLSAPLAPQLLLAEAPVTPLNHHLYAHAVQDVGGHQYVPGQESYWRAFAPQNELSPHDPPMLSFQGNRDHTVPPHMVDAFHARAVRAHGRQPVVHVPGVGHSVREVFGSRARLARLRAWVRARLG